MSTERASLEQLFADLSPYQKLRRAAAIGLRVTERAVLHGAHLDFDGRHGVDTLDAHSLHSFTVPVHDARGLGRYEPTQPVHFRYAMGFVPPPLERWSFIDIGSGKGRAVLLAMGYPFRRVEGVEMDPALHATAQENVLRYRGARRSGEVALHCGDATTRALPPGDVVVFFYNSFQGPLLEHFLDHLEASLRESPRRLLFLYSNPLRREALERRPAFKLLAEGRSRTGLIWRRPQRLAVFGAGLAAEDAAARAPASSVH
jgi:SAM-dependent methyltransferase